METAFRCDHAVLLRIRRHEILAFLQQVLTLELDRCPLSCDDLAFEIGQQRLHFLVRELRRCAFQRVVNTLDDGIGVHLNTLALEVTADLVTKAVVQASGVVVEIEFRLACHGR